MESKGFHVSVFNRTVEKVDKFINGRGAGKNFYGAHSLEELVASLKSPRRVFLMVKAGQAVDDFIEKLIPLLDPGDIIIDGGNSHFPDTARRTAYVESKGLLYIGTGVSGGEEGALKGPSMMPGGSPAAWPYVKPIFQSICAKVEDGSPCCDWVNRKEVSRLEAFGRTVCGIAPWLELGPDDTPEGRLRAEFIDLTLRALANSADPDCPDRLVLDGSHGGQALVDAAFLAQGLLRAPTQLWGRLSPKAQADLVAALQSSREIKPGESNWLLFASIVEAALLEFTGSCDMDRLLYGVDRFLFDHWYKGDAWYGDGEEFHFDYYNSLVIQPMLTDVLRVLQGRDVAQAAHLPQQLRREARFAAQLERLISPEGTYPAVGRSITYRFGSFHALAHTALIGNLPPGLPPAQVRSALSAVIRRQLATPGNFDRDGWLTVGFSGHQLHMSESYINTGSEYLCCAVFLPLGLPAGDPFWAAPAAEWSQLKAWKGVDIGADHALNDLRSIPQRSQLQRN